MNQLFDEKWFKALVIFVGMPMAVTPLVIQSIKGLAENSEKSFSKATWILLVSLSFTAFALFRDFFHYFGQGVGLAKASVSSGSLFLVTSLLAAIIVAIRSLFKYDQKPEKWMIYSRIIIIIIMLIILVRVYWPFLNLFLFKITSDISFANRVGTGSFGNSVNQMIENPLRWHLNVVPSVYTQYVFFKKWWSKDAYGL
jgi:uncharacterized membrane protein